MGGQLSRPRAIGGGAEAPKRFDACFDRFWRGLVVGNCEGWVEQEAMFWVFRRGLDGDWRQTAAAREEASRGRKGGRNAHGRRGGDHGRGVRGAAGSVRSALRIAWIGERSGVRRARRGDRGEAALTTM